MKKIQLLLAAVLISLVGYSQEDATNEYQNSGNKLLNDNLPKGIRIGGYGQIDYNEPDGSAPGKLDVHRLVLLFGYKFNEKVSFLTEIEYEHVQEVYVEQAYLKYKLNENANVLAGLIVMEFSYLAMWVGITSIEEKILDNLFDIIKY